ncbi:60S ribosomal protein L13 [Oleoguttula sp. CCFEE 5521]
MAPSITAGEKQSRRVACQEKAVKVTPRSMDKLRPVVRCSPIKYNRSVRAGHGFSLAELKNLSEDSLKANVERLKTFKSRLILFPSNSKGVKNGAASLEDVKSAK